MGRNRRKFARRRFAKPHKSGSESMSNKSTRRDFLKSSTLLGTAWWVGHAASGFADSKNPLERLNFACIGNGGKGSENTRDAGRNGNVVALCDIDDIPLEKYGKLFKTARKFNDYREMFEVMADKIDAVTVAIPDHSHAPASMLAMKKKKHCFTQKPLTWSVEEARRMRELAAEMKVVTQMGNQGTAHPGFRRGVEVIRSGAIGPVKEVYVWTNRPIWPQGAGRPKRTDPIPKHVHWDLFLGPAPERPYVEGVYHPFKWRGWLDFGTGALGDMACHTANMAVMALELFDPVAVEVKNTSGIVENESYPSYSVIEYDFPERTTMLFETGKSLPACKMMWYDGRQLPPRALFQGEKIRTSGLLIVGEKGTLYSPDDYGARHVLLPRDKFSDFKAPTPTLPRIHGVIGDEDKYHMFEFASACRGGAPTMSNFNYAGRLTETMLLGNLALRAGSRIEWDAKKQEVTNIPSANKFVRREYRSGYSV
jgi:predicted dehydrogenase